MLPVNEKFMAARQLPDATIVTDAGMISDANMKAIEAAGLSFILGMKVPDVPYVVDQWRREHPGEEIPDGQVFTQRWPARPKDKRLDQVIYYTYKTDRARRTLRGIDEQVAKAAKAVAGLAPVKRNRFIQLEGATKTVNRELEEKACTLAGIKGYKTNLAATPDGEPVTADFVIGSYHQLYEIERAARRTTGSHPGFSPTTLADAHARAREEILSGKLPERRRRAAPRVVKRKMSNYAVKHAGHRGWPQPTRRLQEPCRHSQCLSKRHFV